MIINDDSLIKHKIDYNHNLHYHFEKLSKASKETLTFETIMSCVCEFHQVMMEEFLEKKNKEKKEIEAEIQLLKEERDAKRSAYFPTMLEIEKQIDAVAAQSAKDLKSNKSIDFVKRITNCPRTDEIREHAYPINNFACPFTSDVLSSKILQIIRETCPDSIKLYELYRKELYGIDYKIYGLKSDIKEHEFSKRQDLLEEITSEYMLKEKLGHRWRGFPQEHYYCFIWIVKKHIIDSMYLHDRINIVRSFIDEKMRDSLFLEYFDDCYKKGFFQQMSKGITC